MKPHLKIYIESDGLSGAGGVVARRGAKKTREGSPSLVVGGGSGDVGRFPESGEPTVTHRIWGHSIEVSVWFGIPPDWVEDAVRWHPAGVWVRLRVV